MNRPLIKVCCIASIKEAEMALSLGADMLGFVSEMPSGPGVLDLANIAKIIKRLPRGTHSVLLTSKQKAQDIIKQHMLVKTTSIQMVDKLNGSELLKLRQALKMTQLIQVIHIVDSSAVGEALQYTSLVDMLLLDSGNPLASKKELGGTGRVHDWAISREICIRSSIPVLLAGGLNVKNVFSALTEVKPSGVDVCSGIRKQGNLDRTGLFDFLEKVKDYNP